jgi:hypothetical protein
MHRGFAVDLLPFSGLARDSRECSTQTIDSDLDALRGRARVELLESGVAQCPARQTAVIVSSSETRDSRVASGSS